MQYVIKLLILLFVFKYGFNYLNLRTCISQLNKCRRYEHKAITVTHV